MLKPIAFAVAIATVALAARAQDGAVPPPDASATSASASLASPAPASASSASDASSSSAVVETGTIATLDLPGASSSSSSGPAKPVVVPPDKKTLRRINDAIVTYIRDQRGWMDGTYKIQFEGYDDGLVIMRVDLTQGDNAYNFVGAEGQPFKVEIDPATLKIEDERY